MKPGTFTANGLPIHEYVSLRQAEKKLDHQMKKMCLSIIACQQRYYANIMPFSRRRCFEWKPFISLGLGPDEHSHRKVQFVRYLLSFFLHSAALGNLIKNRPKTSEKEGY